MNEFYLVADNGWCSKITTPESRPEVMTRLNKTPGPYNNCLVLDFEQTLNLSKEISEYIN